MSFEFATAGRIVFGAGTIQQLPDLAASTGTRALVVSGKGGANPQAAFSILAGSNIPYEGFSVTSEPTLADIRKGKELATRAGCDYLIAFGGGSVLDAAKAISAMVTNPGDILDYLEVIGLGKKMKIAPLPVIAIPTTAGTGSEVTRNAVISSPDHRYKASLRSPMLLPRIALVDPQLTLSVPPPVTASTGMDALTQLIEPFVSLRANPFTDGFCREGIGRAAAAIRKAYRSGDNLAAREDMSLASLLSGLALANAGLGAVHGFAAPIGGMFSAPHGAICARLLAPAAEANISALKARAPDSPSLTRYQEAFQMLAGQRDFDTGIRWLRDLAEDLQIPPLRNYGITEADFPVIMENAVQASSMKANPVQLAAGELRWILEQAL